MDKRKIKLNGKKYILGEEYRDALLGNVGVATAGISYLTGCDQLQLQYNDSTGRPVNYWVHVVDIEEVTAKTKGKPKKVSGGPSPFASNNNK